jgi:hypothetical protein
MDLAGSGYGPLVGFMNGTILTEQQCKRLEDLADYIYNIMTYTTCYDTVTRFNTAF